MIKDDLKPRDRFVHKLRESLENATFVKLTLSQPRNAEPDLVNIYLRLVEIRDTPHLSFLYRYRRRDVTKNHRIPDGCVLVAKLLGSEWERAHLFTTTGDWQLRTDRNPDGELTAKRPVFQVVAPVAHDVPGRRHRRDPDMPHRGLRRTGGGHDEQRYGKDR